MELYCSGLWGGTLDIEELKCADEGVPGEPNTSSGQSSIQRYQALPLVGRARMVNRPRAVKRLLDYSGMRTEDF